jgi:hypothetical protein
MNKSEFNRGTDTLIYFQIKSNQIIASHRDRRNEFSMAIGGQSIYKKFDERLAQIYFPSSIFGCIGLGCEGSLYY